MPRTTRSSFILLAFHAAALASAGAQSRQEFVIRRSATDTVAVERFTRDASILTGDVTQGNGLRIEYMVLLRPDHTVEHIELSRKPKAGGGLSLAADFGETSAKATISAGGQSESAEFTGGPKPMPFLAVSFAISEQIVRASKLEPGKSVKWMAVRLGAIDTATMTVTRFHADSVSLVMADVAVKVAIAPNGDVIGGSHSTQPWIVERKR